MDSTKNYVVDEPSKTLVRHTLNSLISISLVTPTTKTSARPCSCWASFSVCAVSTFDCPSVMTIAVFAKANRSPLVWLNTTLRRVLFATQNRQFMFYAVRGYALQRSLQWLRTTTAAKVSATADRADTNTKRLGWTPGFSLLQPFAGIGCSNGCGNDCSPWPLFINKRNCR